MINVCHSNVAQQNRSIAVTISNDKTEINDLAASNSTPVPVTVTGLDEYRLLNLRAQYLINSCINSQLNVFELLPSIDLVALASKLTLSAKHQPALIAIVFNQLVPGEQIAVAIKMLDQLSPGSTGGLDQLSPATLKMLSSQLASAATIGNHGYQADNRATQRFGQIQAIIGQTIKRVGAAAFC